MKKMKYLLSLVLLSGGMFVSCTEDDPKEHAFESDRVAFLYEVKGDEYTNDYFYGSTIAFKNTSIAEGTCDWSFGDGESSNDPNPEHIYTNPGIYTVTLTIGEEKRTSKILISDIVPITSYTSSDDVPEIRLSEITLNVEVPNPKGDPVDYTWIFPEGTIAEDGTVIERSTEKDPGALRFSNIGTQRITLKTTLGGRQLEDKAINVHIGYTDSVKTLYYAVKGGNLMALKLIDNLPVGVKNLPIDLGIKSGQHPFNIIFHDSLLYVLDAGFQYYYIDDKAGVMGDGKISVISKDGKNVELMLSNIGGKAFDDPFFGTIVDNTLYHSDRNTGVSRLSITARNQAGAREGNYWLQNNYLGYYGKGISYGAIHANIAKQDNVWWWSKIYGATGIFRFVDSDIHSDGKGDAYPAPSSGIILTGELTKSFAFDKTRDVFYVAVIDKGVYKHKLSTLTPSVKLGDSTMKRIADLPSDTEGTSSERIYICQMILDDATGNLYFAYRAPSTGSVKSGLKYYDPTTDKLVSLIDEVEAYGITINNKKSKLF